jgi:catechol 2,3-dioxygenase-like lactoylglutathione lyase family enzyme
MFKLDHVIIAVNDLDQAVEDYRALGFTTIYGGRHANGATHNALVGFQDSTYLELLAPTGDAPQPGVTDFSPLLAHGEGLVGYALLSHDLPADAQALRARRLAMWARGAACAKTASNSVGAPPNTTAANRHF